MDLGIPTKEEQDAIIAEMEASRSDDDRHRDLIAGWLRRIYQHLPRQPVFQGEHAQALEQEWLRRFMGHAGFPRHLASWKTLERFVGFAMKKDTTRGSLLELPDTRAVRCLCRLASTCGFSDLELGLLVYVYLLGSEEGLQFLDGSQQGLRRVEVIRLVAHALGWVRHGRGTRR